MALFQDRRQQLSSPPPLQVVEAAPVKGSVAWVLVSRRSELAIRVFFWLLGLALVALQSWSFRHFATADAIVYLDMSDFVVPGAGWRRIINGVWSPLYPFLIGITRWILRPSPSREIATCHLLNIAVFVSAFICFEFMMGN